MTAVMVYHTVAIRIRARSERMRNIDTQTTLTVCPLLRFYQKSNRPDKGKDHAGVTSDGYLRGVLFSCSLDILLRRQRSADAITL